jgi:hypothetical protein
MPAQQLRPPRRQTEAERSKPERFFGGGGTRTVLPPLFFCTNAA